MFRWSFLAYSTECGLVSRHTRKTASHYSKLQRSYCFICWFFSLEVFVPCCASGCWKGYRWVFEEGAKKGSKTSERDKCHLIQHVCFLKIHYCPNYLLLLIFSLKNNVFISSKSLACLYM